MALRLKAGYSRNPRLSQLPEVEGLELEWQFFESAGELFLHQLKENSFDLFEFSIADFLVTQSLPEWQHTGWQAIPIHLTKPLSLFLGLHAHNRSGVKDYGDLKGKRFGLPDFGMTAAVWLRIMLRTVYGIQPQDITWYNGRPPSHRHGRILNIDSKPLNGVKLINMDEGRSLNDLLQAGEIDAAYGSGFGAPLTASSQVTQVGSSAMVRQLIVELYKRESVTPVNHVLLIKNQHLSNDPGLALRIFQAFEAHKQRAYERARQNAEAYLVLPDDDFARQADEFGQDPYPSGLSNNRRMLTLIAEQLVLDGLIPVVPDIDGLFAEAVRST